MPKNYYLILGIPPTSSNNEIKTAYRRLVKEFHPDYYGSSSRAPFHAIQEAYSVLGDPEKRRRYDRDIDTVRVNIARHGRRDPSPQMRKNEAEPLVPEQGAAEPLGASRGGARESAWPGPASLFDHFFDIASGSWPAQDTRQRRVDVHLTPVQASQGGHVRIAVPARVSCPDCGGSGGRIYECWRCFGGGSLRGSIPLLLSYPAGITNNHTVEIPLSRHGLSGGVLALRFLVGGE